MVALPKAFALVSAGIGLHRGVGRRDGRSGTVIEATHPARGATDNRREARTPPGAPKRPPHTPPPRATGGRLGRPARPPPNRRPQA